MTYIIVRTQSEFIHCWPEAPREVQYLRALHRHMLHIELKLEVHHDDRELEFIMVKHELSKFLERFLAEARGRTSCEQVAEAIKEWAVDKYGDRACVVQVLEDNENGVEVS